MRFRILGPLEVSDGGGWAAVGPARLRALLAVLLLHANQVVATDRLVEELWSGRPPKGATKLVHQYVLRLRRLLRDPRGRLLVTRTPGYLLAVAGEDVLDSTRFERLLAGGRAAVAAGEDERAARLLAEALGLWRGPALAGVPATPAVEAETARLDELRLLAAEAHADAELACGRHAALTGELRALVDQHPLRERLWEQLMVALYRSSRQAEALHAYREVYKRLDAELGVEPGAALQRLHGQILRADPDLAAPAGAARPRQLPPDVAAFIGRDTELAQLERWLTGEPPTVVAIDGAGGAGKSALAVRAAHRLAGRFPDGQLYANLQGASAGLQPLAPLEVLGRWLRALGVDRRQVPGQVEEAAARLRTELADRRMLLVADNARDTAQVAPLLPGAPGCALLVTSRRVLAGLDGTAHLHLGVLPEAEAVALLGRLAGAERVAAAPGPAAELARWCGLLPLALRIAAARLAARPSWPVETLAGRLAGARRRLDELELSHVSVRASFNVSLQELEASRDPLDRAAAGAFGLLGVLDSPDAGIAVAARLLGEPEERAERLLERLVDAQLLETPVPGRYRLHDLLRLHAREQAASHHPAAERAAALTRALEYYVVTTWSTIAVLRPGDPRLRRAGTRWTSGGRQFGGPPEALAWLEAERPNLVAAVRQAATTGGREELVVQLTQALFGLFWMHSHWREWVWANRLAIRAARRLGDRTAEAVARNDLGVARWRQGRYHQALANLRRGLALNSTLGDRQGQAVSLNNLGLVHLWQGRVEEALDHLARALAIYEQLNDPRGEAACKDNMGIAHAEQGRYDQALTCMHEALAVNRELRDRQGEARQLSNLGIVYQRQERYRQAIDCQRQALAIHEQLGDRWGEAESLASLGIVYQRQERHQEAADCQRQALAIQRELGDRHSQASTLRELGATLRELGRHEEARAHWRQALALFERLGTPDADGVRALLAEEPVPASRHG